GRPAQGSEPGARIRRRFHLSSEPALRSPPAGHGRRRLHRPRSPLVRVRALDPPPRKPALSFTKTETKATRLLVISRGAGSKIEDAIDVARDGHARPITLGRVNDHVFVEACAIGLFGETIALGDSAKDLEFGQLAVKLKNVIAAKRFQYELAGDIEGGGSAMS